MRKKTLIASTVDAVKKILIIDNLNLNGSISIVGVVTTESAAIEIPTVVNPDIDTDSDWTPFVYENITYVLNANNNRIGMPLRGTYRIAKSTSAGNAFGLGFE